MRILYILSRFWALLAGLILFSIMIVTSTNVSAFALDKIARLFGGNIYGLSGYEDFVRLAISCAALMFLPYCQIRKGHIKVELFANLISDKAKMFLDRLWLAVFFAFSIFLVYWMFQGMFLAYNDNKLSPILGWSEWYFYLPGIISLLLLAVISISQIFAVFSKESRFDSDAKFGSDV